MAIDGVDNCIEALKDIEQGNLSHCFIEMSACVGSCIGGPVMEKFRSLAAMLSTLRIKDGELSTEHGAVSTGAFVTARSSGKKAVKTFYVERGKEPADE